MKTRKRLGLVTALVLAIGVFIGSFEQIYAQEIVPTNQALFDDFAVEESDVLFIMPRYTANLDFSDIPVGHVTHGSNKFNLSEGAVIYCSFSGNASFSIGVYNFDTGSFAISDTVHASSCNSKITINTAGNYGIAVLNRSHSVLKITGRYTL